MQTEIVWLVTGTLETKYGNTMLDLFVFSFKLASKCALGVNNHWDLQLSNIPELK